MYSTPSSIRLGCLILLLTFLVTLGRENVAQELKWQTDLERAIAIAEKENKLVLLHFMASWSKPSREIQTFVFSSPPVQRAIHSNVVPVKIDVDEQPELAVQYGVGSVPYDIVITPGKRIVSRRHSPKDSGNYGSMILRLEKTIQQIAKKGPSAVNQNLDDFQQLMIQGGPINQHHDFTPEKPSHVAANASHNSQELFRKSASLLKDGNTLGQDRVGSHSETKSNPPGPLKIINQNFLQNEDSNHSRPLVTATMQPNLQRPPATALQSAMEPNLSNRPRFHPNPTASAAGFASEAALTNAQPSAESPPSVADSDVSPEATQATVVEDLALRGKCPVTLIREGKWLAGSEQWGCVHRQRIYLFATEDYLKLFLTDPDSFSPLLAGFDPVIYEQTGTLVAGTEENGVFMGKAPNVRVVLFQGPTSRQAFEANPKKYIETIRQAMEQTGGSSSTVR